MADIVSPEKRSEMMAGIKGKNTKPELQIRSGIHKRGFRFRICDKRLPGKPDIVFRKYKAVVFVHGCFWHGHDCSLFRMPTSRTKFWQAKIEKNRINDERARNTLLSTNWRVLEIWECALRGKGKRDFEATIDQISEWLLSTEQSMSIRGKLTE